MHSPTKALPGLCALTVVLACVCLSTRCAAADSVQFKPASPEDAAILDVLNRVAKHQLRPLKDGDYKPVNSLAEVTTNQVTEGIGWSYPWGVTLYGVLRSTDVTSDKEAEKFVLEHNRIAARHYAHLARLRDKAGSGDDWNRIRTNTSIVKVRGLMNLGNLDSCGAMGVQFLESMLRHPEQVTEDHKAVAARIADWIAVKQQRLPDGTFSRPTSGGTLWIDDLYMGCPYLVRWAKFTGDLKYLDDAARNIIQMAALLQDKDGVWFHGYYFNEKRQSPIKWGRGNGWAMVATVEVLSAMPENHPLRPKLLDVLRRHIDGIKPLQAPSGMWRQVLDHPELWEETSCTAMFTYAIARAVNRGWIDQSNMAVARKAFAGISKQVTPEGAVNGTCAGTNIGNDLAFYANRPHPDDDLHGRGVVLLAGTEILEGKK